MTLLLVDGLFEASSFVRSEWSNTWSSPQTGRDGSTRGAASLSSALNRILTLPSAAATLIMGCAFNVVQASVIGNTGTPFVTLTRSGTVELWFQISASGFIECRRTNGSGTLLGTSSGHTAIASGSGWRHLAIKALLHSSAGTVEVKLGDTTVLTISGVATAGTSGSVSAITLGNASASSGDALYWDDLYVCDAVDATATQGVPNADFLGDVKVAALIPSGDGDSSQWTPSTGTNHAALVDEVPPNTSDYNQDGTSGHVDLYTLPDLPAGSGTVYAVQQRIYAAATDAGTVNVQPVVKENSTVTPGSSIPVTGTVYGMKYAPLITKRPSDGAQWTVTDVNNLQAGVKVA